VAVPLLHALEQAGLLLPVADGEEPRYPAQDLGLLTAGLKLVEAGVPLSALMELGAEHAAAVERTARRAVDLFDEHVRERIQARAWRRRRRSASCWHLPRAAGGQRHAGPHHFERAVLRAAGSGSSGRDEPPRPVELDRTPDLVELATAARPPATR